MQDAQIGRSRSASGHSRQGAPVIRNHAARELSNPGALVRHSRVEQILDAMTQKMLRKTERPASFICYSHIKEIWRDVNLKRDIFCDSQMTDAQAIYIKQSMLRFLSFLIWIRVKEEWFDEFRERIFHPPDSTSLRFSTELPLSEEQLREIGIPASLVEKEWDEQFRFIPATIRFTKEGGIQTIPSKEIRLPFVYRDNAVAHGGYGKVEFFGIAPEYVEDFKYNHQAWHPKEPYAVAVKSFTAREDANVEVEMLELLKQRLMTCESLSLHHAILEYNLDFRIIFPRADLGDLYQFLHCGAPYVGNKRQQMYTFKDRFADASKDDIDLAPALLLQCSAIAGALDFLHTPVATDGIETYCAHMDLKPDNILIYSGGFVGQWKICDFGISVFKETESNEDVPELSVRDLHELATMNTRARRNPGRYQAPEMDQAVGGPVNERLVGRKSDIWSFGAIFAEVLSFAIGRDANVIGFNQHCLQRINGVKTDYFYSPSDRLAAGQSFQVRPQVLNWLQNLSEGTSAPRQSVECWVKCIRKILQIKPGDRPDAKTMAQDVRHVHRHMLNARQSPNIACPFVDPPNTAVHDRLVSLLAKNPDGNAEVTVADPTAPSPGFGAPQIPTYVSSTEDEQPDGGPSRNNTPSFNMIVRKPTEPMFGVDTPQSPASSSPLDAQVGPNRSYTAPEVHQRFSTIVDRSGADVEVYHPPTYGVDLPEPVHMAIPDQHPASGWNHRIPTRVAAHTPLEAMESLDQYNREGALSVASSATSPSLVPGRPVNAYGVRWSPDQQRDRVDTGEWKPTQFNTKATCVSLDSQRVAYLVKSTIFVYNFTADGTSGDIAESSATNIPLKREKDNSWTGVAIAGSYIAAWGFARGKRPMLQLFRLYQSSPAHQPSYAKIENPQDTPENDLAYFDYDKRVTVSALGLVAVIRGTKILIITLGQTPHLFVRQPKSHNRRYTDIAFNDSGDLLYAWATGSATDLSGGLFVYRVVDLHDDRPQSQGYYDYDIRERDPTTVIPYNTYHGCIIAASGKKFYPAIIRTSFFDDQKVLPRHDLGSLSAATVQAACMYNDHSLIVAQKKITVGFVRHYRLFEYPLKFGDVHTFEGGLELVKLRKAPDKFSQIRAFRQGVNIIILVVHLDGGIEWFRYMP